jgi:hypothetical protein
MDTQIRQRPYDPDMRPATRCAAAEREPYAEPPAPPIYRIVGIH